MKSFKPANCNPPPKPANIEPGHRPHLNALQAGWTASDAEIFSALWGDGPGTRSCAVKGLSLLVANKHDLVTVRSNGSRDGEGAFAVCIHAFCCVWITVAMRP